MSGTKTAAGETMSHCTSDRLRESHGWRAATGRDVVVGDRPSSPTGMSRSPPPVTMNHLTSGRLSELRDRAAGNQRAAAMRKADIRPPAPQPEAPGGRYLDRAGSEGRNLAYFAVAVGPFAVRFGGWQMGSTISCLPETGLMALETLPGLSHGSLQAIFSLRAHCVTHLAKEPPAF